jgi:septum formation protein
MRLVLASTSPYRRALLERLRVPFEAIAPAVDEDVVGRAHEDPAERATHLAQAKAAEVAARHPDALVLGSDQVCAIGPAILGKPGSRERAIEQLTSLSGRKHQLLTAVTLVVPDGRVLSHLERWTLRMRKHDRATLERYVDVDTPYDCAGSYKVEALGIALFDAIETDDFTSIVGLPLLGVARMLRDAGVVLP